MAYKLKIIFSDGTSTYDDEIFETYEDAENEYDVWLDSYSAGAETLELAGEEFDDSEIVDYDIIEV